MDPIRSDEPTRPIRHPDESTGAFLLRVVAARPGLHKSELAHRLGVSWSTTEFHLRRLHRLGKLRTLCSGRDVHVFPAGFDDDLATRIVAMRQASTQRLLDAMRGQPPSSISALGERAGLARKTVRRYLDLLQDAGSVVATGQHRLRYSLA